MTEAQAFALYGLPVIIIVLAALVFLANKFVIHN